MQYHTISSNTMLTCGASGLCQTQFFIEPVKCLKRSNSSQWKMQQSEIVWCCQANDLDCMPSVPRLLQAAPQADGSRWPIRALQLLVHYSWEELLSAQHNTLHPACILCKELSKREYLPGTLRGVLPSNSMHLLHHCADVDSIAVSLFTNSETAATTLWERLQNFQRALKQWRDGWTECFLIY